MQGRLHTLDDCSSVYLYLRSKLRKEITEPVGARDLSILIDMFTVCTPDIKKHILHSFCSVEGVLHGIWDGNQLPRCSQHYSLGSII